MATRPPGGHLGGRGGGGGHSQPHPKQVESGQQTALPPLEQEDASLAESKDTKVEPPHSGRGVHGGVIEEEVVGEKEGGEKVMTASEEKRVGGDLGAEKEADIGVVGKDTDGMDESSEEEEEEEGWITPDNLQRVCEQMGGLLEEEPKGIAVGCLTSDFAMQVRDTPLWYLVAVDQGTKCAVEGKVRGIC